MLQTSDKQLHYILKTGNIKNEQESHERAHVNHIKNGLFIQPPDLSVGLQKPATNLKQITKHLDNFCDKRLLL